MKDDNATVLSNIGPDLFEPPHILPVLMELFAGEKQQILLPQELLLAHLTTCQYCRTAVVFLLDIAQEYDRVNNNPETVAHDLLIRIANIQTLIDAHKYERLGTYAEAIVAEGHDKANLRFPVIAAHLKICSDCRSMLEATIDFITEAKETD
jgi:predicted anti-sigma-YlaC factor YlaD